MKYLILITLLTTTSAIARVKIKLSDLGKINYDQTMIEVENKKELNERQTDITKAEQLKYETARVKKYNKTSGPPKVPTYSPFTKFNPENQAWETN
jgi:hypothetical protein